MAETTDVYFQTDFSTSNSASRRDQSPAKPFIHVIGDIGQRVAYHAAFLESRRRSQPGGGYF